MQAVTLRLSGMGSLGEGCFGCGNCVVTCRRGVLSVMNGNVEMTDFRLCELCKDCVKPCPTRVIESLLGQCNRMRYALARARRR